MLPVPSGHLVGETAALFWASLCVEAFECLQIQGEYAVASAKGKGASDQGGACSWELFQRVLFILGDLKADHGALLRNHSEPFPSDIDS